MSELAKLLADKLYVFALTITEEDARKRFIDRVRKLQLRKNRETMLKDAMSVYPISMQNGYSSENQKNFKNAIGVHFTVARKRPKGGGGQTTLILGCKFKEVEEGAEDQTVQDAYKPKDSLL